MKSLSPKETLVLELLVAGRDRFGLELVEASAGGLKRGTVYVTLGRMEAHGLVTSRTEDAPRDGDRPGGMPRRLYRATALGRRALGLAHEHARVMQLKAEEAS
ncbi:MAG: helix-turn-helix transcriptional regulator [Myxococcota bacterium]